MDRRTLVATAGMALSAPFGGCLGGISTGENTQPERPWSPSTTIESQGGTHHLFIENHTNTTETAWIRVVREDGATLVDGRYELPDTRGIRFENIGAWEKSYTIELAIADENPISLQWNTPECGPDSESSGDGGSRNASVRVKEPSDSDRENQVSLVVDECDALFSPGVPIGPAKGFRLDE